MPSTTTLLRQFVSHIAPNRQSRTLFVSRLGFIDWYRHHDHRPPRRLRAQHEAGAGNHQRAPPPSLIVLMPAAP
jgi:hypothetical protein